jgi:hypothetical protein
VRRHEHRLAPLARVRLAAEIAYTYVTVRRLLRRKTLPETVVALRLGSRNSAPAAPAALALGRHLAWATVKTLGVLPADSRCLMRSLVLTRVMARRGLGCTFLLSARSQPEFQAHAWVEYGGEPLLLPGDEEHRQLLRL